MLRDPFATISRFPFEFEPPSSSGPGRRPFKAVTGIRTPLGVLRSSGERELRFTRSCGAVWSARRPVKAEAAGSNPVRTAGKASAEPTAWAAQRKPTRKSNHPGRVAQSAEHTPEKRGVTGSTPVPATHHESRGPTRGSRVSGRAEETEPLRDDNGRGVAHDPPREGRDTTQHPERAARGCRLRVGRSARPARGTAGSRSRGTDGDRPGSGSPRSSRRGPSGSRSSD